MKQSAIIIGAGPAGLTAAYELLKNTNIKPIILEESDMVGGISKTVNYKGNRIDIGGHRFFSKSDRVMNWWKNIMPIQGKPSKDDILLSKKYPKYVIKKDYVKNGPNPEKVDRVMLVRDRLSRIFYLRSFFDYPVSLSGQTISNLGLVRMTKIGFSYLKARLLPTKNEVSLEDFFINRFGRQLYLTFFKDYTEKVWGVPCNQIKAEWGAQRIKGLSATKAILHALKNITKKDNSSINQKNIETTLIDRFFYPKFGPGQLWEEVASDIIKMGGIIHFNNQVIGLNNKDEKIAGVISKDQKNDQELYFESDYVFSTMPVKDLIKAFQNKVPAKIKKIADGLMYRDFITVGLLLKKLKITNRTTQKTINHVVPDNWIYIQERDVKLGRLQIFNNWSPYMVKDLNKVWIGLEYFCNEGDALWNMKDKNFADFAIGELEKIDIINKKDVVDSTVIKVKKTYPAYFGTYDKFPILRKYTDSFENLFLIGRNGMHRYNNQDHSMLTAMVAVDNISKDIKTKNNVWDVNTEKEYHEAK